MYSAIVFTSFVDLNYVRMPHSGSPQKTVFNFVVMEGQISGQSMTKTMKIKYAQK